MDNRIPGRLFTFGCSITRYYWPTWADILGQQWEYYENWGKSGSGNHYIFNSVIECINRHKITSSDMIMILWTSIGRTDYYQVGHWHSKINICSQDREIPFNCPDGHEITNFALMYAIHELLTLKKIPFKSMTWSMYDVKSNNALLYQDTISKIERWKFSNNDKFIKNFKIETSVMNSFQTVYDTMKGPDWPPLENILADDYTDISISLQNEIEDFKKMLILENKRNFVENQKVDYHPLPSKHLEVVQRMCPDIKLRQSTIEWVNDIEDKILQEQPFYFKPNVPVSRIQI